MPEFDEVLALAIDEIWKLFDVDGDGVLDRDETRAFVDYSMKAQGEWQTDKEKKNNDDDSQQSDEELLSFEKFDEYFRKVDADGSGELDKEEMHSFLKDLIESNELQNDDSSEFD